VGRRASRRKRAVLQAKLGRRRTPHRVSLDLFAPPGPPGYAPRNDSTQAADASIDLCPFWGILSLLHFYAHQVYSGAITSELLTSPARRPSPSAIGERVRQLRIARGLTQTELGLGQCSKEYISQIERGRARPTPAALDWLADRLGVPQRFLETGISSSDHERTVGLIARAEAAVAAREYEEALGCLERAGPLSQGWESGLALRALLTGATARSELGRLKEALTVLEQARDLVEGDPFTDVDRANVLFHIGRCRYRLSSIPTSITLFTQALDLMRHSDLIDDRLRSRIFRWRSRCYRRQRDWEAARADVEVALELSERLDDRDALAHGYFQASIIAERNGQWVLARSYAERAKTLYEEQDDRLNVGRLLNNLGGLTFLLGDPDEAVRLLKAAFSVSLEVGSEPDAAQAVSSLAQVHLRTGQVELAEQQARHALSLLDGRIDFLDEQGNAQLVLGRALLEQGKLDEAEEALAASEATFEQLSSASHRAAAWTAQAELSIRRGDQEKALRLYRLAAETLQDFRF
jgi:tetratricopeptide (TPR) repeat protein